MKNVVYNADCLPAMRKKYQIIYADPPWSYRNMGNIQATANSHYKTMSQEDIEKLPIQSIVNDNCILFLWATFPKIQEALNVIKAWGFEYKTVGFVWVKKNKNWTNFFGVGWYTRSNAEVCLIGVKGKAPKISNSIGSIVETIREYHSKKPYIIRKKIVEFSGDILRIELFARQKTEGWDVWGNEVESDIDLLGSTGKEI
ncbi:hypothetical protein LCGC14_0364870 [marine sediment metagenome]|uniref:DNA methyltransferase n=1 Tax=marine sediment metagenome TaxID=412755 RepID=A0A0F9T6Z7_9ZZZZ